MKRSPFNLIILSAFMLTLGACRLYLNEPKGTCFINEYNCICLCKDKYVARLFSPYTGKTLTHSGRYTLTKFGDTIILNSVRKPTHHGMKSIQMYDNHHELDSILIYVINPDNSLLYSKVEIGGQVYYIGSDGKKVGKNGSDSVILHGWQGDFAPIKLQSDSINTIRMTYSFIDREFCFAENSYFIDELFTLKNDTLTNLRFKYILKKCN